MLALIMPIAAGMALFAKPIVQVIYERGEFTAQSTAVTAGALAFFSIGMIGLGINEILNKCFYAMQNGKTPMFASIIGIGVNVILAVILFYTTDMGVGGLALAASVALLVISAVLCIRMNKTIKFMDRQLWSVVFRLLLSTVVMAAVAFGVNVLTQPLGVFISLALTVGAGGAAYIACVILFGVIKRLKA